MSFPLKNRYIICKYWQLTSFLKQNLKVFISKKSKVFSSEQVGKFLSAASDNEYLVTKISYH